MAYFEDLELGEKFTTPGRTITDAIATTLISIGGFTAAVFNDEREANKTIGWRVLPARFGFALMAGLVETSRQIPEGEGTGLFVGVRDMRVKLPLKVGDTVYVVLERKEKSETSNARWGKVIDRETLMNQRGEVVIQADVVRLFERKSYVTHPYGQAEHE